MFDARLRPLIDPPLNRLGAGLARAGLSANALTLSGLALGIAGAGAIVLGEMWLGLVLVLANRLFDGLDGAVARARGPTALGGYLDIVSDFVLYVSVPLAFGLSSPVNTLPALVLVASFVLTGVSFLAFAAIAAQREISTEAHGRKAFYYSTGIAEGGETIVAFVMMCIWPQWFGIIAYVFAGLCALTVIQRSALAIALFRDP